MCSDRVTQMLLALIAVGLWALVLSQAGLPDLTSSAEAAAVSSLAAAQQDLKHSSKDTHEGRAGTATLPLRWSFPWAGEYSGETTYCGTAIVVTNETNSTVDVQVEWFLFNGTTMALRPLSVNSYTQDIWVSGKNHSMPGGIDYYPFIPDDWADIGTFIGYARLHATDPRIQVAAFQYCRDGNGTGKNMMSMTSLPAFPAGATAQYFQAGMPAAWTPPMVEPEVPE